MRSYSGLVLVFWLALAGDALAQSGAVPTDETLSPPLSRVREGGTPFDPDQPLMPYALQVQRASPVSGFLASPEEYSPSRGILVYYQSNQWASVVRDLVVGLTAPPEHDDIAYVICASTGQRDLAINAFTAGGADMSKVQFYISPGNALWIRDYGPHFIWQDGALALVDSHYYPSRPLDNFQPTIIGDDWLALPTHDMGLYYSGGNFQPGPNRTGFVTALLRTDNPVSEGFSDQFYSELYSQYQGIDTLHIMPQLPPTVDGTGHIDMWLYLVDADTVIISKFKPGSNQQAIEITENAVPYMQNLGFEVFRTPAWNSGGTHWTYTNAFRVTDRIFVPIYNGYPTETAEALAAWEAAAGPGVEILPVECTSIIPAAGAIHCIVMQVPRYLETTPAAHVISPRGGELLVAGTTHRIEYVASDTNNLPIAQFELYYSTDGGNQWTFIANTTNPLRYDWTVPQDLSAAARVKVVAVAQDNDRAEASSAADFEIAAAQQTVYTFASGAGVDKFGWGYNTASWSSVDGVRKPVTSEISTLVSGAYNAIGFSDATGDDFDPNRYISPAVPTNNESTHTFEFTIAEDPAAILDLGILWEGYADQCTQAELYVWDYVQGQWSDGAGLFGQNRFMDNWAGNRDGYLTGHVRSAFDRYLNAQGQLTLLIYGERRADETYHDFVEVVVTSGAGLRGDLNCDGSVDFGDINPFVLALSDPGGYAQLYPDCPFSNRDINGDGAFDFGDVNPFIALLSGN